MYKKYKSGKNMNIYHTKMLSGFLKYTLFFHFKDTTSKNPQFLNFTDIKCLPTELERRPFSLKFKMRVRTHSQRYVTTPGFLAEFA